MPDWHLHLCSSKRHVYDNGIASPDSFCDYNCGEYATFANRFAQSNFH